MMKYNNKIFFDTHAHYNNSKFLNIKNIILNNLNNYYILNVGYDIDSSYKSVMLAKKYDNIYASIGIHPLYTQNINTHSLSKIATIINNNKKIVAIGEIGLDNYGFNYYKKQKEIFINQLNIAYDNKLPIILHIRNLYKECLDIINYYKIKRGIVHCFSSTNINILNKFVANDFFISFAGNITFKNNNIDEIIKLVPNNKILIETDSPYLCPNPFRGKINTSFNIKYIAKKIANIKNINIDYIYKITMENALSALNIKK